MSVVETSQCPLCGRLKRDWSDEETRERTRHGHKGEFDHSREDRLYDYRQWRRDFGRGCYVTDIDQLEWVLDDSKALPVAILELSRIDGDVPIPSSYRKACLERIRTRDSQERFSVQAASMLGAYAWFVLFRHDLSEFWVYNLSMDRGWWHLDQEGYRHWIEMLRVVPDEV
jgi:hypothetical protein